MVAVTRQQFLDGGHARLLRLLLLLLFAATLIFAVNAFIAGSAHAVGGRDDPSGGGNTPGGSDSTGRGPSDGGGGIAYDHDSTYAITSAWTNRTNPDRAKYPSPMGYYNGAPGTPTWRPLKDQNRSVGTETKNQWEAKNFPCRTNVSNTDTANGVTYSVLSLGVSWDQNVEWKTIKGSSPLRMEIKRVWINGVECLGKTNIGGKWRYCPTEVHPTAAYTQGPWGVGLPREPTTISIDNAAVKPAVHRAGSPSWDPGAKKDDFRKSILNGNFPGFSKEEKIERAENCGGVGFEFKAPDLELAVDNVGWYSIIQPYNGRYCTWYTLGQSKLNNVTPQHGISGSKNVHTEVWDRDTKWTGCERRDKISRQSHDLVMCIQNPAYRNDPENELEWMFRRYNNVDPNWRGEIWNSACNPQPIRIRCSVRNNPEIMVTGKSQGWTANLNKRNTTLMADGKQASITWPEPAIQRLSGRDKHMKLVRNRTMAFTQGTVDTKFGYPGIVGTGPSDPYSTNIALDGAKTSGWADNPLNLRFYRTPEHNTLTNKAGKMRVNALYRYDTPTVTPTIRFDPLTGIGKVISERVDYTEVECGSVDVAFWVATSRPSN